METELTASELSAYSLGYKAALALVHEQLAKWSKAKETHSACDCSHCMELRDLAAMKYVAPYDVPKCE